MEILNTVMSWFGSQSWTEIAGVIALWLVAFDKLAKLTPTTKDDSVLNWIYKIFAVLGVKVPDLEYNRAGNIVAAK